ncbi:MAG: DNA-formamidopyrimidine glycosylase [Chloroflexi bacterium]|nr:DNA-formamidopyrimidine glycosylase [Chloroflexota bacterium]
MPELPEVETIARQLREGSGERGPGVVGRTLAGLWTDWPRHLAGLSPQAFGDRIAGQRVEAVGRRGKYLIFDLSRDSLLIHLRMSGRLAVAPAGSPRDGHDHTCLLVEDGAELRFNDTRKFGRVHLVSDLAEVVGALGPEPLDPGFSAGQLGQMLAARSRALKPLLLDQRFLAGVGNIYADEALHRARLHPLRRSNSLSPGEVERLHRSLRETLLQGIRLNGASIDWVYPGGDMQNEFVVYGRTGRPCPRCGAPIQRITVGQRGTHLCPNCQKLD